MEKLTLSNDELINFVNDKNLIKTQDLYKQEIIKNGPHANEAKEFINFFKGGAGGVLDILLIRIATDVLIEKYGKANYNEKEVFMYKKFLFKDGENIYSTPGKIKVLAKNINIEELINFEKKFIQMIIDESLKIEKLKHIVGDMLNDFQKDGLFNNEFKINWNFKKNIIKNKI